MFASIYVGNGLKFIPRIYSPPAPPAPQQEYISTFDVTKGEVDPLTLQNDPVPPPDANNEEEEEEEAKRKRADEEEEDEDDDFGELAGATRITNKSESEEDD